MAPGDDQAGREITTECGIPVAPLYSPATTELDYAGPVRLIDNIVLEPVPVATA